MKRVTLVWAIVSAMTLSAQPLKTLFEAINDNELVKEKDYTLKGVQNAKKTVSEGYLPTLNAQASIQKITNKGPMDAGLTSSATLNISYIVWDGGKKESLLKQSDWHIQGARHTKEWTTKTLQRQLVFNYTTLLGIEAQKKALESKLSKIREEKERIERFYEAGIVGKDVVEKLRAALAQTQSDIVGLDVNYEQERLNLELLSQTKLDSLAPFRFTEPQNLTNERNDIYALEADVGRVKETQKEIDSRYYPTITLSDAQGFYRYNDDSSGLRRVENQNRATLSAQITLFDWDTGKLQKEQNRYQELALREKVTYEKRKSSIELELAKRGFILSQKQLLAREQFLTSSTSTFLLIEGKYRAGLASTLDYLDALSQKSDAEALFVQAKATVEEKKAEIYYILGIDLREKLQ